MSQSAQGNYKLCVTTVDNKSSAKEIALALLQQKLVVCVNVVGNVNSYYQWEGEIVDDRELVLLMKTRVEKIEQLETCLNELHPYEVPEFIVLSIEAGSQGYLNWIDQSLA